jgi:hypothetical protein
LQKICIYRNRKNEELTKLVMRSHTRSSNTSKPRQSSGVQGSAIVSTKTRINDTKSSNSEKSHKQSKQESLLGSVEIQDRYNEYRIYELTSAINLLVTNYNILKNVRYQDTISTYSDNIPLTYGFSSGVKLSTDITVDQDFINYVVNSPEYTNGKKSKILHNIFLGTIYKILSTGSGLDKRCNYILLNIDRILLNTERNDKAKKNFDNLDVLNDMYRYKKAQRFLQLTMQEKKEVGLLDMTFEEQEEYFQNLEAKELETMNFDELDIEDPQNTEAQEGATDQTDTKQSVYGNGVRMDFDFDYENDDTIDDRNEMIT